MGYQDSKDIRKHFNCWNQTCREEFLMLHPNLACWFIKGLDKRPSLFTQKIPNQKAKEGLEKFNIKTGWENEEK